MPEAYPTSRNDVGEETGSRNMAIITSTGESTFDPSTPYRSIGRHFDARKLLPVYLKAEVLLSDVCQSSWRLCPGPQAIVVRL